MSPAPSVDDGDIERVLAAGSHHSVRQGRAVLHSFPIGYAIDDTRGVKDPRGMLGRRLGVDMHVMTVDAAAVRNQMLCVERCHLSVEAMVATPYVSGLAALTDDEADLGAAVVDIGAGTTTIAVFNNGNFIHADGFSLGGRNVTMDIARGLNARIADAERVKTLHGSVLSRRRRRARDDHDVAGRRARARAHRLPRATDPHHQAARRRNSRNAARQTEELAVRGGAERACRAHRRREPTQRIAGTCRARVLGRQVRIGRPLGLSGLPEAAKGPAFAVAAGLLVYPQLAHVEHFEARRPSMLGRRATPTTSFGSDDGYARASDDPQGFEDAMAGGGPVPFCGDPVSAR